VHANNDDALRWVSKYRHLEVAKHLVRENGLCTENGSFRPLSDRTPDDGSPLMLFLYHFLQSKG
jgi:hypothetical protein